MDANVIRLIVMAIAAIGGIAWLAGVSVMARATRERRARGEEAASRFDIEPGSAAGTVVGEAEVPGRPEEVSAKLASLLARDGAGALGPFKIIACDRKELIFELVGIGPGSTAAPMRSGNRGRFRFDAMGSSTRIEYAVEVASGRALIPLGWLFVGLGLAALIAGGWLVFSLVLPSPNPGVRTQAIQLVQVVHFLWPPFLFAGLARQPARMIATRIDAILNNIPYA